MTKELQTNLLFNTYRLILSGKPPSVALNKTIEKYEKELDNESVKVHGVIHRIGDSNTDSLEISISESEEYTLIKMTISEYDNEVNIKYHRKIENLEDLCNLIDDNKVKGCVFCGAIYIEDDFAFAKETGECQYCHSKLNEVMLKEF